MTCCAEALDDDFDLKHGANVGQIIALQAVSAGQQHKKSRR